MKILLRLLSVSLIFSCTNNEESNEQTNNENNITITGCGYTESNLLENPSELCDLANNKRGFVSNIDADKALNRILDVTGMSSTFVMQECNGINNFYATSLSGVRYILYDPELMKDISDKTNEWSNLSILAHEIGHHVNGHPLDIDLTYNDLAELPTQTERKRDELEADYYSGFVMYKLGASLEESQEAILVYAAEKSIDNYPSRNERLVAIEEGYNKAKYQDFNIQNSDNSPTMSVQDYQYDAYDCYERGEYEFAIEYTSKAIALDPSWSIGYYNRGIYYDAIEEYSKSISDFSKYIKLVPDDLDAYLERGYVYDELEQYENAISDYTFVIQSSPISEPLTYLSRGNSYDYLEQYNASITDYSTYIGFFPDSIDGYFFRGHAYSYLKMYEESINDLTKYIELVPDDPLGYAMRAIIKEEAGIPHCSDDKAACNLGNEPSCEYYNENCEEEEVAVEKSSNRTKRFRQSHDGDIHYHETGTFYIDEQGYLTIYYQNGDMYEGNVKDGYRYGFGTYTWKNGDKYIGNWDNPWENSGGVRHGKGKMIYANETVQEGLWEGGDYIKGD